MLRHFIRRQQNPPIEENLSAFQKIFPKNGLHKKWNTLRFVFTNVLNGNSEPLIQLSRIDIFPTNQITSVTNSISTSVTNSASDSVTNSISTSVTNSASDSVLNSELSSNSTSSTPTQTNSHLLPPHYCFPETVENLCDPNKHLIKCVRNPKGNNPPNEPPSALIDPSFSTKWLDRNRLYNTTGFRDCPSQYSTASIIEIEFVKELCICGYVLWAANDSPSRDPTDWMVFGTVSANEWCVFVFVFYFVSFLFFSFSCF
jgi:hypothetical protein